MLRRETHRRDVRTNLNYDNEDPGKSPRRIHDSANLFLVVYPSGAKSWEYRYEVGGRPKALILGPYGDRKPALGVKAARARRDEIAAERNRGLDPIVARKLTKENQHAALRAAQAERERLFAEQSDAQLVAEQGAVTLRAVAEKWLAGNRPHWSKGHGHQCEQSLTDHVYPVLGDRHPGKIEPSDVLDLIGGMLASGHVETARRVRQRLDAVYEHGALYFGLRSNPVALAKRELTKRFKVARAANPEEHFPTVSRKEIPQLLRAMRAYVGTPVTRALLWFVCLTGCRTGEARGATWTEFDLDAGTWAIPAARMKARRSHTVYLASPVVDLLRDLRPHTRGLAWVFPHPTRKDKTASENAVLFALAAIGFKDRHSGHGFRSMFSTLANESGLHRSDVIEAALAHKEADQARAAYNSASYEKERRALADWYAQQLTQLEQAP